MIRQPVDALVALLRQVVSGAVPQGLDLRSNFLEHVDGVLVVASARSPVIDPFPRPKDIGQGDFSRHCTALYIRAMPNDTLEDVAVVVPEHTVISSDAATANVRNFAGASHADSSGVSDTLAGQSEVNGAPFPAKMRTRI